MPYHSSSPPPPSAAPRPPSAAPRPPSAAPPPPPPMAQQPSAAPGGGIATVSRSSVTSASTVNAYSNSSINNANYNLDQTVRVFDKFQDYDVNVPAAEYDIVYSYFRKEMTTASAAGNFTVSLFRVAEETGVPALDLLEQFRGQNGVNLNVQLAYNLNSIRNKATLLGVGIPLQSNQYAARLIVQ